VKLGMTAVMPSAAFTDEHECMKIAKQLLGSMRRQMADIFIPGDQPFRGQVRLSILVQTLADAEPDRVGEAVRAALDG